MSDPAAQPFPDWQPLEGFARAKVRWGFGDAAWAVAGGFGSAAIAAAVIAAARYANTPSSDVKFDALDNAIASLVQFAVMATLVYLTVGRRGRGLRHDLGLVLLARDWYWILIGMGTAIAAGMALLPINQLWTDGRHGKQQIGETVRHSASLARVLLVITVVLIAPIVEETVFRGIVLRSALRRMPVGPAVLVSGVTFAALHLLDITTFPAMPALFVLGTGSAIVSVRSGNMSRSIYLHMGFNLLGAISLLT